MTGSACHRSSHMHPLTIPTCFTEQFGEVRLLRGHGGRLCYCAKNRIGICVVLRFLKRRHQHAQWQAYAEHHIPGGCRTPHSRRMPSITFPADAEHHIPGGCRTPHSRRMPNTAYPADAEQQVSHNINKRTCTWPK